MPDGDGRFLGKRNHIYVGYKMDRPSISFIYWLHRQEKIYYYPVHQQVFGIDRQGPSVIAQGAIMVGPAAERIPQLVKRLDVVWIDGDEPFPQGKRFIPIAKLTMGARQTAHRVQIVGRLQQRGLESLYGRLRAAFDQIPFRLLVPGHILKYPRRRGFPPWLPDGSPPPRGSSLRSAHNATTRPIDNRAPGASSPCAGPRALPR